MNEIEVINNTDFKIEENVLKVVNRILSIMKVKNSYLAVIFITNKEIQKLNKEYRNIDKPTDVLSFYIDDNINSEYIVLGDIFISVDKMKSDSLEFNISLKEELYFLLAHGILHLLGYDHQKEEEAEIMFKLQKEIIDEII